MSRVSDASLVPRNEHTLVVLVVARISGCATQKEMSLDDQVDHAKEEVAELYDGPVEYRVVATKGKGERLDRPELAEVEGAVRSREPDLAIMEDVGRLVRGTDAVRLWGIAVDHGVRCIAPNDCLDSADDTWEEDLIAACRDHVGHNAHTSKRLKKKLMNRFKKFGAATGLPIAGYIKPEDARTYDDWKRDEAATAIIRAGLNKLRATLNCSAVADFFNREGFSTGPYCRLQKWDGKMVRRFYQNRLLAGHPGRGHRHSVKHHESGRRISVKNPKGPAFLECSHLAHVNAVELDEVNAMLDTRNDGFRRKPVNGVDPLWRKPRKQAAYPSQGGCTCWYCGHHFVWGANGVTGNLMCSNSREWQCWNSFGVKGSLVAKRLVDAITAELYRLDRFDAQFSKLVQRADRDSSDGVAQRRRQLERDQAALGREKDNLLAAITQYGPQPMFEGKLSEIDKQEKTLAAERYKLEVLDNKQLHLPKSTEELRRKLEEAFQCLTTDSFEFGDLMRRLVPEFHVYLVRLLNGGHPLPRARITLNLAGAIQDAEHVPELQQMLTRTLTIDLFEHPPQRERIRDEVVRLVTSGLSQRQIATQIEEKPKLPVLQQAIALDKQMKELGLETPYRILLEPPDDYSKLRRHRNAKYRFTPLDGYQRPSL